MESARIEGVSRDESVMSSEHETAVSKALEQFQKAMYVDEETAEKYMDQLVVIDFFV